MSRTWTESLELDDDGRPGTAPPLPRALAGVQRLVHAVANDRGIVIHRTYEVRRAARPGDPVAIVPVELRAADESDEVLRTLAVGELALLDARNRFLVPPFPSPLPPTWSTCRCGFSGRGGCRALAIPVGVDPSAHAPLTPGTYRLTFSIRPPPLAGRVPDPASTYQDSVTLVAGLGCLHDRCRSSSL